MFGDLMGDAEKLLGGAAPGEGQDAGAQPAGGLETGELVNHFLGMVPDLPDGARSELASTVLGALGQNGTSEDDVAAAGVPTDDAKGGDPAALGALLQHATSDPAALETAAVTFIGRHPELIQQYAPFAAGLLKRFGV